MIFCLVFFPSAAAVFKCDAIFLGGEAIEKWILKTTLEREKPENCVTLIQF